MSCLQVGHVITVSGIPASPASPINLLSKHCSQNTCKQVSTLGANNLFLLDREMKLQDIYNTIQISIIYICQYICTYMHMPQESGSPSNPPSSGLVLQLFRPSPNIVLLKSPNSSWISFAIMLMNRQFHCVCI